MDSSCKVATLHAWIPVLKLSSCATSEKFFSVYGIFSIQGCTGASPLNKDDVAPVHP